MCGLAFWDDPAIYTLQPGAATPGSANPSHTIQPVAGVLRAGISPSITC
jgi:hypothetical protein